MEQRNLFNFKIIIFVKGIQVPLIHQSINQLSNNLFLFLTCKNNRIQYCPIRHYVMNERSLYLVSEFRLNINSNSRVLTATFQIQHSKHWFIIVKLSPKWSIIDWKQFSIYSIKFILKKFGLFFNYLIHWSNISKGVVSCI